MEYYLSDFLSVIESREKKDGGVRTVGIAQYENGIPENGRNVAAKWCGIGGILVGAILAIIYITIIIVFLLIAIGIIEYSGKM